MFTKYFHQFWRQVFLHITNVNSGHMPLKFNKIETLAIFFLLNLDIFGINGRFYKYETHTYRDVPFIYIFFFLN